MSANFNDHSLADGSLDPNGDSRVLLLAAARLKASRYPELWRVDCQWDSGSVVLVGNVPTFYLKQVAQTLVRGVDGVGQIDNRIRVTVT